MFGMRCKLYLMCRLNQLYYLCISVLLQFSCKHLCNMPNFVSKLSHLLKYHDNYLYNMCFWLCRKRNHWRMQPCSLRRPELWSVLSISKRLRNLPDRFQPHIIVYLRNSVRGWNQSGHRGLR